MGQVALQIPTSFVNAFNFLIKISNCSCTFAKLLFEVISKPYRVKDAISVKDDKDCHFPVKKKSPDCFENKVFLLYPEK